MAFLSAYEQIERKELQRNVLRLKRGRIKLEIRTAFEAGKTELIATSEFYESTAVACRRILADIKRAIKSQGDDDETRLTLLKRMVTDLYSKERGFPEKFWNCLLIRWVKESRPPLLSSCLDGATHLGRVFAVEALGFDKGSALASEIGAVVRGRCAVTMTTAHMASEAFRFEVEESQRALMEGYVLRYGPPLLSLAVNLIPVTRLPKAVGLIVIALGGFIDFLVTVTDAESDGEITEEEANEAAWALSGILPFNLWQNFLVGRSLLSLTDVVFMQMLIPALREWVDSFGRRLETDKAGWHGYDQFSADEAFFIPDHALEAPSHGPDD